MNIKDIAIGVAIGVFATIVFNRNVIEPRHQAERDRDRAALERSDSTSLELESRAACAEDRANRAQVIAEQIGQIADSISHVSPRNNINNAINSLRSASLDSLRAVLLTDTMEVIQ